MGEVRGIVNEELENNFRMLAMKKFGYGKGSLSKALEEALQNWVKTNQIAAKAETRQIKRRHLQPQYAQI